MDKKNIVPLSKLLNEIELSYDENTNTYIIESKCNILLKSLNMLLISEGDTVIISGDKINSNGKIHLNPSILNEKNKKLIKSLI